MEQRPEAIRLLAGKLWKNVVFELVRVHAKELFYTFN